MCLLTNFLHYSDCFPRSRLPSSPQGFLGSLRALVLQHSQHETHSLRRLFVCAVMHHQFSHCKGCLCSHVTPSLSNFFLAITEENGLFFPVAFPSLHFDNCASVVLFNVFLCPLSFCLLVVRSRSLIRLRFNFLANTLHRGRHRMSDSLLFSSPLSMDLLELEEW